MLRGRQSERDDAPLSSKLPNIIPRATDTRSSSFRDARDARVVREACTTPKDWSCQRYCWSRAGPWRAEVALVKSGTGDLEAGWYAAVVLAYRVTRLTLQLPKHFASADRPAHVPPGEWLVQNRRIDATRKNLDRRYQPQDRVVRKLEARFATLPKGTPNAPNGPPKRLLPL